MAESPGTVRPLVCATAQHRQMLDQVLDSFGVQPDYDLNLMSPGQTLAETTARVLAALDPLLAEAASGHGGRPGRYHHHPGRRPGGLLPRRSGGPRGSRPAHRRPGPAVSGRDEPRASPAAWPRCTSRPPPARRLQPAGGRHAPPPAFWSPAIPESMPFWKSRTRSPAAPCRPRRGRGWTRARKLILVTAHRRESFGAGIERICAALGALARRDDVQIVYPVHRNPNVHGAGVRAARRLPQRRSCSIRSNTPVSWT